MQVFATRKTPVLGGVLNQQLTCFTKIRMAVRIMKLIAILLLGGCLQLSARGIGQTITISVTDAPLEKVFQVIEKQTDYVFFVKTELLKLAKSVTLKVANLPLQQVLDLCFKDQPLKYSINGKIITIAPKNIKTDKDGKTTKVEESNFLINVTGEVTDPNGNPLEGATVRVKESSLVTITNTSGIFILKGINENAILEISFVGYEMIVVPVSNRTAIRVSLKQDVASLNEVVINKGYYTETKRFSTSNVGRITSKEIEQQPVQNPLLALQGRVPGLLITQVNGIPGGGVIVRIQGISAISASSGNDPFYVVDGVPFVSQMLNTTTGSVGGASTGVLKGSGGPTGSGNGNPLSYINPSDIESIEILKDADATAIYGSRAANGAILITTKKGKAGPTKIDINLQQGWGKVSRTLDILNTEQYVMMRREAFKNDNLAIPSILTTPNDGNYDINGLWDTTRNTDWQKVLIGGVSKYSNINLTVSGGTGNTQYLVGGTYNRSTSVFPGNFADQRGAIHFNIKSASNNQKFNFQFSGNYLTDNNALPANDFTSQAIKLAPNAPEIYNSDGTLNWQPNPSGTSSWDNPLANMYYTYTNKTTNLISNAIVSYRILKGLEIKGSFGFNNLQTNEFKALPSTVIRPENRLNFTREADYTSSNMNSWIIEPQANFNKVIGKGKIDILVGSSIQQKNDKGEYTQGTGYNNDLVMKDPRAAASIRILRSAQSVYKYNALYGRLNYILKEKYIVNLTARRDGSSRFGPENQFHNFGSVGVGWIFSDEQFVKKNVGFLSFGKLRGSYGTTGNDQIGDYRFMNLYNTYSAGVPYQGAVGVLPNRLYNPYLQWEETKKLQVGLDFGFLDNRVSVTANYVHNQSSNQLLGYELPIITGYLNVDDNFPATVKNTAWEFSLNSNNINHAKFVWKTSLNITFPKNELVSFPNLATSTYSSSLIIGKPLGIVQTYHFLGVNPLTGRYQISDQHGNPTTSPNFLTDRIVLLNLLPKYYGGIQNSFEFKRFQLDFLFQFINQLGTGYSFNGTPGRFLNGAGNQPVSVLERWQKPGDIKEIEGFSQINTNPFTGDASYVDASFIRLKNISLSYQLPLLLKQKLRLSNCRFYAHGQNLLTITNYKGLDPETQSTNALPPLRILTIGLQVTL